MSEQNAWPETLRLLHLVCKLLLHKRICVNLPWPLPWARHSPCSQPARSRSLGFVLECLTFSARKPERGLALGVALGAAFGAGGTASAWHQPNRIYSYSRAERTTFFTLHEALIMERIFSNVCDANRFHLALSLTIFRFLAVHLDNLLLSPWLLCLSFLNLPKYTP